MWDRVDAQFAKYESLPVGEKKRQVGLAVYLVAQALNVDGGNGVS